MLSFSVNRNLWQTLKAIASFQLLGTDLKSAIWAGAAILEMFLLLLQWKIHLHLVKCPNCTLCIFSGYLLGQIHIRRNSSCRSDDTGHAHSNKQLLPQCPCRTGLQLKKLCSKLENSRRLQASHVRAVATTVPGTWETSRSPAPPCPFPAPSYGSSQQHRPQQQPTVTTGYPQQGAQQQSPRWYMKNPAKEGWWHEYATLGCLSAFRLFS